ncbi:MAG: Tn3 family transposase [Thermoactinomyces sp.]
MTDYLNEMGFPNQDQDFVKHLQDWMNHMCRTVDQKYLDCGDVVVINELSIKAGKISSAMLLRKLGNYSRKNRLYKAFR